MFSASSSVLTSPNLELKIGEQSCPTPVPLQGPFVLLPGNSFSLQAPCISTWGPSLATACLARGQDCRGVNTPWEPSLASPWKGWVAECLLSSPSGVTALRHVLHSLPEAPWGAEAQLPTPESVLASFPSLRHSPFFTQNHVLCKQLAPKSLSQSLVLGDPAPSTCSSSCLSFRTS